jgi:hypothetical protein
MKIKGKAGAPSTLDDFIAYYRRAHSGKTSAGRVLKGNAKKFLRQELAHIVTSGKISENFDSEIKAFWASQKREVEVVAGKPPLAQQLESLSESQKKELIKALLDN